MSSVAEEPVVTQEAMVRKTSRSYAHLIVALVIIVSATVTALAMRRTSATFDEITTVAVGARGWETGDWSMMPDFPPVMQYLYGLPGYLSRPNYPAERPGMVRYQYAREFLWKSGNSAEVLMFRGRLVAVLAAATLILLTYLYARQYFGTTAGVLAAVLIAFMPDVLAHGGVAYNDIPLAPAFLGALWAIDAGVRRPALWRGVLAGALVSLALGIKHSALALGPVAIILLLFEFFGREDRKTWLRQIAPTLLAAVVVGYLVQALLYRGDFTLSTLRASTNAAATHISGGHGPGYLLGEARDNAWWYFYPVAFLFKTPVAFSLLLLLAILGALRSSAQHSGRALLLNPARAAVIAIVVFGFVLLRANLVIGFRYALPLLPLFAILAAAGCAVLWQQRREYRIAIAALALWSAGSALSFYPHFLAYTSEHQDDRDRGWEVFVDSSLDWGQGLLELRDWMREENVDQIYLGYFGSALPEGYGINYIPMPGFFPPEPRVVDPNAKPRFAAVSATLLVGQYLTVDFYGPLRRREPYRVLAHSIYVYEINQ